MVEATDPVFQFESVSFSYPGGQALFHELSLDMEAGQLYHLSGPSGSGKSSLLRLMIRLETPQQGRILFKENPVADTYPPHLRRSVLYMPQTPVAMDNSVRDFLLRPFAFKANQDLDPPDDQQLESRLTDFQLTDVGLGDHTETLSVGQLQRLSFIRGLLLSPELLLLDEPTSALDKKSADILEDHLEKLCGESDVTVLLVSHREMRNMTTNYHSLILRNGKITQALE